MCMAWVVLKKDILLMSKYKKESFNVSLSLSQYTVQEGKI